MYTIQQKTAVDFVMLIDDDEGTRFLHRINVEDSGVTNQIIAVKSGPEALKKITGEIVTKPDIKGIIFMDINMPLMNGWELLDELKAGQHVLPKGVLIIMVSATEYPKDLERIKTHPMVHSFIPKPLGSEQVLELALIINS